MKRYKSCLRSVNSRYESYREQLAILASAVYKGGRHFGTEDDLQESFLTEWEELNTEDLQYVVSSIPSRVRALHNAGTECNLTERNSDFVYEASEVKIRTWSNSCKTNF